MDVIEVYERIQRHLNPDVLKLTMTYLYIDKVMISKSVIKGWICEGCGQIDLILQPCSSISNCNVRICQRCDSHPYCQNCFRCDVQGSDHGTGKCWQCVECHKKYP